MSAPRFGGSVMALQRRTPLQRRTQLRAVGTNDTARVKESIQALLREIGIERDGGCVLRHYPDETGQCGGYRKDGELVLQWDHLNSRVHSVSYADLRLGVIACKRHHLFFKKQYPDIYMRVVKRHIGPERTALLEAVQADKRPHRMTLSDWKKEEAFLITKLRSLSPSLS